MSRRRGGMGEGLSKAPWVVVLAWACASPAAPSPVPEPGAAPVAAPEPAVQDVGVGLISLTLAPLMPAGGTTLVVDHVRRTGSAVAGGLGEYLGQMVAEAVGQLPGVTLVNEASRDQVLALLVRWSGDAYDRDTVPEPGHFAGARKLLHCSYVELDDPPRVRLSLQLVDIATNTSRRVVVELVRSLLPPGLSSEPDNAERIAGTLAGWERELPVAAFPLDLWTDRGIGARYLPGDGMRVFVRSARAGHLALQLLDAEGEVSTVFPNPFSDGDRVPAQGVIEIPDDTMAFELQVSGAPGAEVLRAVVTSDDGARAQALCGYRIGKG